MDDSADLRNRIQAEYIRLGYDLGWKLLYGPESTLKQARVAFIGLNPGGSSRPKLVADFATSSGSAYMNEIWEGQYSAGQSKLQQQVQGLFRLIEEPAERVLAGNLVPFRSPSWAALQHRPAALRFGAAIWREILGTAQPTLVIGMGSEVCAPLKEILGVQLSTRVPVGWGNITGERGEWAGGAFVGLPHLSRFAIVGRPESMPALRTLLRA